MDVNANSDVKGYGVPAAPTAELEAPQKPSITPVPESSEGVTVNLNEQALRNKKQQAKQNGKEEKSQNEQNRENLEEAVKEIQERFETMGSAFRFGLHKDLDSESIVGQLRDKDTDEIIKQFPSEEILKLRAKLQDLIGLLFDEKV